MYDPLFTTKDRLINWALKIAFSPFFIIYQLYKTFRKVLIDILSSVYKKLVNKIAALITVAIIAACLLAIGLIYK